MTRAEKPLPPLEPMTSDVSVRPEADGRQRVLEQLDDVTTMVDGARLALAEGRWSDRQAIEDIARAVLLLVEAIEDWMECGSARRDEPFDPAG